MGETKITPAVLFGTTSIFLIPIYMMETLLVFGEGSQI